MNWEDRLAPGRPPLRPGEFALMTGWSYETIRKLMNAEEIPGVAIVTGGEKRIPVSYAREVALKLEVVQAA